MPVDILVGTQWGDEGKGKLIDVLTGDVDMVVRFQGGNNAGHTVEIGSERYVLHLVPSGIFRPGVRCVIGNGLVVDPVALVEEIEGIRARGITADDLELSDRAQLIFVYHKRADALNEKGAARKIGTTGRGIGPAYCDKMRRCGIRGIDLCKPEVLSAKFRAEAARYNKIFADAGAELIDIEKELALVLEAAAKLAHFEDAEEMEDTDELVRELHRLADKLKHTDPEAVWPITLAAITITRLNTFTESAMAKMILKNQQVKQELEEVIRKL